MPPKHHTGITAATRDAIKRLGRGATFGIAEVLEILDNRVQTYQDEKRVKKVIYEMSKAGEIERVERGLYRATNKPAKVPEIRERMWRVLRASRSVKVEDLQELAGASEVYALEWLRMLARQDIVRHLRNGKWQMIHDPIEMPVNAEKVEKLRAIRVKKAEALAALDKAGEAINEARAAISTMEEEGNHE